MSHNDKSHVPKDPVRKKVHIENIPGETVLEVLFGKDEQAYEQFIEQDVQAAYDFARKELEYHDALNGLGANMLEPEDMVNQAIADLIDEKKPQKLVIGKRLTGKILEVIHSRVRKLEERERKEISVQGNVKDPALEDGFRTLGDHVLDFWQPDQDLSIMDVIPDVEVPTPAEIEDMKSRQALIYKALNDLPRDWRENFVLMAVQRWTVKDLAEWRNKSEDQIKEDLTATQGFLQDRLKEQMMLENRKPQQKGRHTHDQDDRG